MQKPNHNITTALVSSATVLPLLLTQANAGPASVMQTANGLTLARWVQGATSTLPNTSVADWWYGCSPTSAGMLMGFYDRNGYAGVSYSNLVPGGVAEEKALGSWPNGQLLRRTIASEGHQRDFYSALTYGYNTGGGSGYGYLGSGDDLAVSHNFDCLADFMGTSQDGLPGNVSNPNGSTTFWNYTDGSRTYAEDLVAYGLDGSDGMCGIKEYVTWAGYEIKDHGIYSQYTDNVGTPFGFTFEDYKSEIDAGRAVLIHVEGHTMLGIGYDDAGQQVELYNTWWDGIETMTWGGSYYDMDMWGVTVMELAVPEPQQYALIFGAALGIFALGRQRR